MPNASAPSRRSADRYSTTLGFPFERGSWHAPTRFPVKRQHEMRVTDEVENVQVKTNLPAQHTRTVRAQSIDPFRQPFGLPPVSPAGSVVAFACGKGRHRRPATQRALRALGTAALVAACGSIAFGTSSILPYLPFSCKPFAKEKEKLFLIYYCKNGKMML